MKKISNQVILLIYQKTALAGDLFAANKLEWYWVGDTILTEIIV